MASLRPSGGSPSLICYDGSEVAKQAIALAADLLTVREAIVLTVWQPTDVAAGIGWTGGSAATLNFAELDRAASDRAALLANDGVSMATEMGLDARARAVRASGPVWSTICEVADRERAAVIVMGSRGLSGVKSLLMGSVSSAVLHHAGQPTLVIHPEPGVRYGSSASAFSMASAS
jgi:nucleotide-binding universal stress UspA family protein